MNAPLLPPSDLPEPIDDQDEADVVPIMLEALREARQRAIDQGHVVRYSEGDSIYDLHPDGTKRFVTTTAPPVQLSKRTYRLTDLVDATKPGGTSPTDGHHSS